MNTLRDLHNARKARGCNAYHILLDLWGTLENTGISAFTEGETIRFYDNCGEIGQATLNENNTFEVTEGGTTRTMDMMPMIRMFEEHLLAAVA